ncbi:PhzF family phenazine biosynthesis protein [Chryseolinea sp. T2]|uniref:PhzF family phenazine biosynthesis protein n=1 Tax=Chryseolinea sp. T2 TaxID=3129255 RepID=UPI003077BB5A
MTIRIYQVDAFTDHVFGGNPAAVCPLDRWPDDRLMQNIAMENNLAETAFLVRNDSRVEIRWFTPTVEVDLCGHATLGSAYVLFNFEGYKGDEIHFFSPRSGDLTVRRDGDRLTMNFPADLYSRIQPDESLTAGVSIRPLEIYRGKTDYMFVYAKEHDVKTIVPNFSEIAKLSCRGVIVTAPGDDVDFVSRFFAPQSGVNEDPVTGSAHTTLTPYWAKRLSKTTLSAIQLSSRKGQLTCKDLGDRVEISGTARSYLRGEIEVD